MSKSNKNSRVKNSASRGIFLISLGCPKNFVDTEIIAGALVSNGYQLIFDQDEAEVTLINTCAFIPEARDETYQVITDAIKWKKQRKNKRKIIVTGCLIQWDKQAEYKKFYPEVDLWCGVDDAPKMAGLLAALDGGKAEIKTTAALPEFIYNEDTPRLQLTLPHLAYLKIADGCNNCCSYCSIPNIRGHLRSRSIDSVVAEGKNLLAGGVKELLIIAQDITAFGHDRAGDETLCALLRELDKLEGDFWIRLLYTHPAHFTDELIDFLAQSKHVLPYLDIPLQHINDDILQSMGRMVSKSEVTELLQKLRSRIAGLTIRTTFITGFPGEGDAEFAELRDFVLEQEFDRLGVFSYSPEPNTPAADFEGQIDRKTADVRAAELMEIQQGIAEKKNQKLLNQEMLLMVDILESQQAYGRSAMDAPEIDNSVLIQDPEERLEEGEFCKVRIIGTDKFDLIAELL